MVAALRILLREFHCQLCEEVEALPRRELEPAQQSAWGLEVPCHLH